MTGFEILMTAIVLQGTFGLVSSLLKRSMPQTKSRDRIPACDPWDWTKPGRPDWYFNGGK